MKKRVNMTIEESILKKLDQMAADRGIDRSTMVQILVYDSYDLVELRDEGLDTDNIVSIFAKK